MSTNGDEELKRSPRQPEPSPSRLPLPLLLGALDCCESTYLGSGVRLRSRAVASIWWHGLLLVPSSRGRASRQGRRVSSCLVHWIRARGSQEESWERLSACAHRAAIRSIRSTVDRLQTVVASAERSGTLQPDALGGVGIHTDIVLLMLLGC